MPVGVFFCAAGLPRSRRTARGVSAIRKKDEKARDSELLRKASPPSGWTGTEARNVREERGGNIGPANACRAPDVSAGRAVHEVSPSLLAGAP